MTLKELAQSRPSVNWCSNSTKGCRCLCHWSNVKTRFRDCDYSFSSSGPSSSSNKHGRSTHSHRTTSTCYLSVYVSLSKPPINSLSAKLIRTRKSHQHSRSKRRWRSNNNRLDGGSACCRGVSLKSILSHLKAKARKKVKAKSQPRNKLRSLRKTLQLTKERRPVNQKHRQVPHQSKRSHLRKVMRIARGTSTASSVTMAATLSVAMAVRTLHILPALRWSHSLKENGTVATA